MGCGFSGATVAMGGISVLCIGARDNARHGRNGENSRKDCKLMLDYVETAWYNFNLRGYSANFAMQM